MSFMETGPLVSIYSEGDVRPQSGSYFINVAGLDVTWLILWMPEYAETHLGNPTHEAIIFTWRGATVCWGSNLFYV